MKSTEANVGEERLHLYSITVHHNTSYTLNVNIANVSLECVIIDY